jgi:hypothetical protein
MNISRRGLIGATLGVAAATAVGVVTVARSGDTAVAAPGGGGAKYQSGPRILPPGPGDMIRQLPNKKWHSHLLPFAAPFSDKASLLLELKRARDQKLIG